ncbi:uncharacterized protein LOC117643983 [Thrips palmi]|uniref:Uncharacterized protein LOC117643983 n=1 Tax=Thrips palmi TaxID=161013 RepID=A0A6P8YP95_THRPL|nr:uncharacterized protein LOC117643983 [Thrips palmi]
MKANTEDAPTRSKQELVQIFNFLYRYVVTLRHRLVDLFDHSPCFVFGLLTKQKKVACSALPHVVLNRLVFATLKRSVFLRAFQSQQEYINMDEFIPLGARAVVPKRMKNSNKINHEKRGKGKKILKGKKMVQREKAKMVKQVKDLEATDQKPSFRIKLIFQQRCPAIAEICKLHPLIRKVSIPKRPPSIRHCYLKFKSAEELEEVRLFLDKKHFEPFHGILRCHKPLPDTLNEIKSSNPELLDQEYLTPVDIKHAKFVHNKKLGATIDVKCNSTARELFLRYGVPLFVKKENQNGGDAPPFTMDEDQNGRCSPSISSSEEEDDMNAPEVY